MWSLTWKSKNLTSGTLTGGLEAFDVSGGLQEITSEVEEDEEEGQNGDEDPGDHWRRDSDHPENLQEHLLTETKKISDVKTEQSLILWVKSLLRQQRLTLLASSTCSRKGWKLTSIKTIQASFWKQLDLSHFLKHFVTIMCLRGSKMMLIVWIEWAAASVLWHLSSPGWSPQRSTVS